jgi:large subunit ribosomal protein L24
MLKGKEREPIKSRLRKGDLVMVIAGNDRGKTGRIMAKTSRGFIVEGINVRKRHQKQQQQQGGQKTGGIIEMETPIHPCKLMVCGADGKPVRLKVRSNKEGERELVYKQGNKDVVYRKVAEKGSEK